MNQPPRPTTPPPIGGAVLLVDDEPLVVRVTSRVLTRMGVHEVRTANSTDEALALLAQGRFDLVITDLSMPVRGGDELLHELRRRGDPVPVLLVTGHSDPGQLGPLLALPQVGLLAKPWTLAEMEQAVRAVLVPRAA